MSLVINYSVFIGIKKKYGFCSDLGKKKVTNVAQIA
jgi:hypothetical protein